MLTSSDGLFLPRRWTSEMKEKLGTLTGDNIALGESPFGQVGYVDEKLMNALSSTVNGFVVGGQCGLFEYLQDLDNGRPVAVLSHVVMRTRRRRIKKPCCDRRDARIISLSRIWQD